MVLNKKGFTLIELLIVVVIIGILAAIAIPKFAGTKSKAYVAAMKSDLKNLVTAQESYFSDNSSYGAVANNALTTVWAATTGVNVTTANNTATGFSATATHAGVSTGSGSGGCGVFVGGAAEPNAAVTVEGEVQCW